MASQILNCIDRAAEMFSGSSNPFIPDAVHESDAMKKAYKRNSDYCMMSDAAVSSSSSNYEGTIVKYSENSVASSMSNASAQKPQASSGGGTAPHARGIMVQRRAPQKVPVPQWHPKWELGVVLSGHLGWVRSISFDPSNQWFATGSMDRTIKIWDFPKSVLGDKDCLKLTLTGHISGVRGLAVSDRHPYLFSAGEDKMVKCWDLEYNKVVRHYHGHLSGVFALSLHPILDLLISGGRDSVARVWDMRTKNQVHVLGGHTSTVSSILTAGVDPQVITGSYDSTIKLFDLAAGKCMSTLTHHKKSVRALVANPRELSFISAGADNMKKWQMRDGKFLQNLSSHNSVINSLAVNEDGVCASGGDDGTLHFTDYSSGYNFQKIKSVAQPGSLDAESGIFASTFDLSGSRLITCEADKTIKIWKENRESTEDTDPIEMEGWTKQCLALKKR